MRPHSARRRVMRPPSHHRDGLLQHSCGRRQSRGAHTLRSREPRQRAGRAFRSRRVLRAQCPTANRSRFSVACQDRRTKVNPPCGIRDCRTASRGCSAVLPFRCACLAGGGIESVSRRATARDLVSRNALTLSAVPPFHAMGDYMRNYIHPTE